MGFLQLINIYSLLNYNTRMKSVDQKWTVRYIFFICNDNREAKILSGPANFPQCFLLFPIVNKQWISKKKPAVFSLHMPLWGRRSNKVLSDKEIC